MMEWAVLLLVLPVVGALMHEATHYLTIWPVAEDVRLVRPQRLRLAVEYDLYDEDWRLKWANISDVSPSLIGLSALAVAIVMGAAPAPTLDSLGIYGGWLMFTLGGIRDYL